MIYINHNIAKTTITPTIAIINTSIELIEALEMAMNIEGYNTVATTVTDLKRQNTTLKKVFGLKKPDVIIYDVALPYKENWEYLQTVRVAPEVEDARFIITTTNRSALEALITVDSHAFELTGIIDKPFDLDVLIAAVRGAVTEVYRERQLRGKIKKETTKKINPYTGD